MSAMESCAGCCVCVHCGLGLIRMPATVGDTLQSATTAVRSMGINVQRFFDPELGVVIGEKTALMPGRPRHLGGSSEAQEIMKTSGRAQRSAAPPSVSPPLQEAVPTLPKPRENMYGIGLRIAESPPHKVLAVNDLRDAGMKQINHVVFKGDILRAVGDTDVEILNMDELEWHIFGHKGEMVTLFFFRPTTGQSFAVPVKRHVPIQFALGMSVTRQAPYSVKRVDELLDPNNDNVGDLVEAGDLIEFVNGRNCANEGLKVLDDIVFGPIDSLCKIVFRRLRTGQNYELVFKRHIPVSSWWRWEDAGGMQAANWEPPEDNAPSLPVLQGGSLKGFEADDVTGEFI